MEKYFENLGYKKVAAIFVGIGVFLFLVFLLPVIIGFPKPAQSRSNSSSRSPISAPTSAASSGSELSPTGSPQAAQNLLYSGDNFTLQYPPVWTVTEAPVAGGGSDITFSPNGSNDLKAKFEVQVTKTPIQNLSSVYSLLGYTKSDGVVNGISASKFSGSQKKGAVSTYATAVVLVKNGSTFVVDMEYTAAQKSVATEVLFSSMLNSMKVK